MQIIAKKTLRGFWRDHAKAEMPLKVWHSLATGAEWKTPQDVKDMFGGTVDFVGDNRIIFDICGNDYRLIVHVAYTYKRVLIKFFGTHAEYDKIDAETV